MNAIQAKMSKPMPEDDLFGNLLAEKLEKLPFVINLQAKNETDNMVLSQLLMSHYLMYIWTKWVHYTPSTQTPSCTNNRAINLPANSKFASNRISFPQLQTQDSQSQYAVGKAFLQHM